jgi:hypothetical protein
VRTDSAFLIDDQGFLYNTRDTMSGEILSAQLGPAEKANGWVLFYIPEDISLAGFIYITSWGGASELYLMSGLSQ